MSHSVEAIETLVRELFRRNSSCGKESNEDLFTEDAGYEGAYHNQYFDGAHAISKMHCGVVPLLFNPFVVTPVAIYPVVGGNEVIVECESDGVSLHTGRKYSNKYAGFMQLRDGKICWWREYYDPQAFMNAVGPEIVEIMERIMPPNSIKEKK